MDFSAVNEYSGGMKADQLIGSTVIDLEDRWHSKYWKKKSDLQLVPIESRNIFEPNLPSQNHGACELFIEMLESSAASDKKPSSLVTAADTLIEIRIVVRTAEVLSLGEDEFMDVQIGCVLTCDKYEGPYPM